MGKETLKKIAAFQYTSEALIYKGKLESEEIEVFMFDNYTVDTDPLMSNAIGGVKLFVKSEDFEKAEQILLAIGKYSVDDQGKALRCAKCGSEEIQMLTTIRNVKSFLSFVFSFLLFLLPFYTKYKYQCNQCKNEF
ncbi:DUF2007 domain-containing protein [Flavobacterium pedocola]